MDTLQHPSHSTAMSTSTNKQHRRRVGLQCSIGITVPSLMDERMRHRSRARYPLPRESENSLGTFSPPPASHRPAPRCTARPSAAQGQPRVQAGGAAARRRAALLKFRFRSLAVISRPRALRQACVSRDALHYFRAARSFSLASRSWHGSATARRHRRARGGGGSRVLRARRVPAPPGSGTHRGCRARTMQQRHVRRRPVYAPRVFRAMGRRSSRLSQILRSSSLLV